MKEMQILKACLFSSDKIVLLKMAYLLIPSYKERSPPQTPQFQVVFYIFIVSPALNTMIISSPLLSSSVCELDYVCLGLWVVFGS